jgi:hypothetical protein
MARRVFRAAEQAKRKAERKRSRAANRDRHPSIPRLTWTVDELCAAADCSRSYYEEEKRQGRGARETRYGRVIRVTPDDGRAWIAARRTA